ncbi:MAG: OsmC family protein [Thermomicrobiales bacterium]
MKITAQVQSQHQMHLARVATNGRETTLPIPVAASGFGSGVNGGELLFLALATCFCNDLYREAAKRQITLTHVGVDVDGTFDRPGEPARDVSFRVELAGEADRDDLIALVRHTDTVAEVQNTLRQGMPVTLASIDVIAD